MSDKTITQLAIEAGVETGGTENALAILKFAKAYADQEKRKEAIAFQEWFHVTGWEEAILDPHKGKYYSDLMDEFFTIDQVYDLFIQSLPKTV